MWGTGNGGIVRRGTGSRSRDRSQGAAPGTASGKWPDEEASHFFVTLVDEGASLPSARFCSG